MAKKLNKQAALGAGNTLDKAADMVQLLAKAGHLKPEIAEKFAYQCDLLSDHFAKSAGIDIQKIALSGDDVFDEGTLGMDPEEIGEEVGGPLEKESDEPYMDGHFSQQENRELREKEEAGELSNGSGSPERQTPKPGVQAALAHGQKLAALYLDIHNASRRCASSQHEAVKGLGDKLAAAGIEVLGFQSRLLEGTESSERMAALTTAAGHVLPHLANDVPPAAAEKLARMVGLFTGIAKPV